MNPRIPKPVGRKGPHPDHALIDEFVDGALLRGEAAAMERHLAACAECAAWAEGARALRARFADVQTLRPASGLAERVLGEVAPSLERRRNLVARLQELPRLSPEPGFQDRVVARVSDLQRARRAARARARRIELVEARAARWFGDPRRLFAALGGLAVVPMAVLVAVLTTLLSYEEVSAGSLLSFARWKVAAAFQFIADAVAGTGLALPSWASGLTDVGLSSATFATLGIAMAAGTLASVWVLYRMLSHPPLTGTMNGHSTLGRT